MLVNVFLILKILNILKILLGFTGLNTISKMRVTMLVNVFLILKILVILLILLRFLNPAHILNILKILLRNTVCA